MEHLKKKNKRLLTGVSVLVLLFHIIPFYIMVTTALKAKGDFSSKWVFPKELNFQNFTDAWQTANLGPSFFNTVIITACSAILLIFFGSMAAYPMARRQTTLNKIFYFFVYSDHDYPAINSFSAIV